MPNRTKSIRVLLIDSRPVVLLGLHDLVNGKKPKMETVGRAASYAAALDLAEQTLPDVILFSFFPDALDGLEVLTALALRARTKVLVLKGLYETVPVAKAIAAGARGVVLAEDSPESIVRAIAKVHEHDSASSRAWTSGLNGYATRESVHMSGDADEDRVAQLTQRELELIRTVAANPADKYMSIAERLGISEHTVHNHLSSIYHKLHLINRIDLLVYALKHRLAGEDVSSESTWVELH